MRPLYTKSASEVLTQFQSVHNEIQNEDGDHKVESICADRGEPSFMFAICFQESIKQFVLYAGKEFHNKLMAAYLRTHKIILKIPKTSGHCGKVER